MERSSAMESTIVIKVKYGETLRRFTARVNENELGLDMGGLREKVLDLFNFAPDADLVLTYIDEDGDVVTLADEEDLRDVMRQSLNPLRITVKLTTAKGGSSYARSSGSSTPMRSPRVQKNPLPNLNAGVAELLKSVPEPFREGFTKLSHGLSSKAASSAPSLTELVECILKLGEFHMNTVSEPLIAAGSSTVGSSVSKDPKASKDDEAKPEVLPNMELEEPTTKNNTDNANVKVDLGTSATPAPGSMNLNIGLPGDSFRSGCASDIRVPVQFHFALGNKEAGEKLGDCNLNGNAVDSTPMNLNLTPLAPKVVVGDSSNVMEKSRDSQTVGLGGGIKKQCPRGFLNSSVPLARGYDILNEYVIPMIPPANDSAGTHTHFASRLHPFKRSYNHGDGMGGIFHRGVRCDGCGIHPITGPRFKSKVKDNYDLCSICFAKMGNEAEYVRMDRPASYRLSRSFKGFYDPMQQTRVHPPPMPLPNVFRGCAVKSKGPKLDSRFIQDINVLDGTVMAPSTSFTKIWRMRNNGGIAWPQGAQLVWIGGDKLSDILSVELEISVDGLPADHELDIAVDFTAPDLPGRYISYWRMAAPSGQKFGQRVWVLIQVEADLKDSLCNSLHGLNLNLPPETNGARAPEIINVGVEPMVNDSLLEPENSVRATESVKPIVDQNRNKDPELNFPINDTLLVGGFAPVVPPPKAAAASSSAVSYPYIDLSEVAASAPYNGPTPIVDETKPAEVINESSDVEQVLLRELEEMGFKQIDLNKEVLRMNEYNMEQSVDDLCGVAEWDPILEELQEMGFCDNEMNKRLLKKNNGSIKRVVMDLIAGEKPMP